jgi:hypothetical protein
LKEWINLGSRNTPSTTNLEEEEIVDDPVNDGNTSMPELVKRPNLWRKTMMMMMMVMMMMIFKCLISNAITNKYIDFISCKPTRCTILP